MSSHFLMRCVVTGVLALLPAAVAFSQSASVDPTSANDLARAVFANELKLQDANHGRWAYHLDKEQQGKKTAKEVVQTKWGSLDHVMAVDGHPLNARERQQETKRIEDLVRNPGVQQRLEQAKKKEAEQWESFFKTIPNAFIFSYAGREGDLIKLSFKPNPAFQPTARIARIFSSVEGEMWVHATQHRLARVRGSLIADVKFAGGLLGHLEKGGQFNVEQTELSANQWELTAINVDVKGMVLFFKTIAVQQKEHRSNFRKVPDGLTLAEAADILTRHVLVAASR